MMFVSPSVSLQSFYNWQTQRKMWWRKMSAFPGRYSLTDIQTNNLGEQTIDIKSTFDWGDHILETIILSNNGHYITSTTNLISMVVNSLCDAYDETSKKPYFRFHRKIAPFKISFAITQSDTSNENLVDLASFLSKKLRDKNISVLNLPSASQNSLESQWLQYDQLGIPFTVILNSDSLKNGIIHLRNRDTTLKEQVHISDLSNYVEQLFLNF